MKRGRETKQAMENREEESENCAEECGYDLGKDCAHSVRRPWGSAPERLKTVSSKINTVLPSTEPLKVETSVWIYGVHLCLC